MTMDDRLVLNAKIGVLLQDSLVRIRSYTYDPKANEEDHSKEINDLTDILHNLPKYIVGLDEQAIDSHEQLRAALLLHVKRFFPKTKPPELHRYIEILDLEPEAFQTRYRNQSWGLTAVVS